MPCGAEWVQLRARSDNPRCVDPKATNVERMKARLDKAQRALVVLQTIIELLRPTRRSVVKRKSVGIRTRSIQITLFDRPDIRAKSWRGTRPSHFTTDFRQIPPAIGGIAPAPRHRCSALIGLRQAKDSCGGGALSLSHDPRTTRGKGPYASEEPCHSSNPAFGLRWNDGNGPGRIRTRVLPLRRR